MIFEGNYFHSFKSGLQKGQIPGEKLLLLQKECSRIVRKKKGVLIG